MTDEQVIKALECCKADSDYTCKDCPCREDDCVIEVGEALALIKRQKAENERLSVEIERLTAQLATARADAVREFAERVKAHTKHLFNCYDVSWCDISNIVDELVEREMTEGEG